MRSPDPDPATVFALLEDEHARSILELTSHQALSAKALDQRCEASLRTIYRRLDALTETGLLEERIELDANGNHYSVYEVRIEGLEVRIDDGAIDLSLHGGGDAVEERPRALAD